MRKLLGVVAHPGRSIRSALRKSGILPQKNVKSALKKKPESFVKVLGDVLGKLGGVSINSRFRADIAIYFDGDVTQKYQLEVWFLILAQLEKKHSFIFIVRSAATFHYIAKTTGFPVVLATTIADVMQVYELNEFKCILYVNHAARNFQSLIHRDALHIHINHGESDKLSTITNQAKAYDYVFVVGPAAYDRYKNNLIRQDMSRFVVIGRPQLEHVVTAAQVEFETVSEDGSVVEAETREDSITVLYAPTWEGTHSSMNYSSVDWLGPNLVERLLQDERIRLIYRPHPRTGVREPAVLSADNHIKSIIKANPRAAYVPKGDIVGLYAQTDIAIFDNSTAAIDFLMTEKPMLLVDTFSRILGRVDEPAIKSAAMLLTTANVEKVADIVHDQLRNDPFKQMRDSVKTYYLGDFDYLQSGSTKAFVAAIEKAMTERDEYIQAR